MGLLNPGRVEGNIACPLEDVREVPVRLAVTDEANQGHRFLLNAGALSR